jgi:hypothetical protein
LIGLRLRKQVESRKGGVEEGRSVGEKFVVYVDERAVAARGSATWLAFGGEALPTMMAIGEAPEDPTAQVREDGGEPDG